MVHDVTVARAELALHLLQLPVLHQRFLVFPLQGARPPQMRWSDARGTGGASRIGWTWNLQSVLANSPAVNPSRITTMQWALAKGAHRLEWLKWLRFSP